jgi:glyoxylase-like metal-dependent hydrolase (beta-lactamase superfamily II)
MSFEQLSPSVFCFADICNVYVVRRGDRALVVDSGSGAVFEHLCELGVKHADLVLHTHHHRDQCAGSAAVPTGTETLVPVREAELLGDAEAFWRGVRIYDRYDCASIWNTPMCSLGVARALRDYETVEWDNLTFQTLPTPGHTRGSVTYFVRIDGLDYAFCGDLIYGDGHVATLHDLQWHYVDADATNVAMHSAQSLRRRRPDRLAPSHGPLPTDANAALTTLEENLRRVHDVIAERFEGDMVAPAPASTDLRFLQVSRHVIAAVHPCAHFYAIRGDHGGVLFIDYGFATRDHLWGGECRFVEHSLQELEEQFGIGPPELVIPTHYHDDHVSGIPYLQRQFGTKVWAFETFADILERPYAYRIPCLWQEPLAVDRTFADRELVEWGGYRLTARHLPGHTWWATALFGEIDGRSVGIIGDQLQRSGLGAFRGGGPIYRNRVRHDSFSIGMRVILDAEPELLLTGHSGPVEVTPSDLAEGLEWAIRLEEAWRQAVESPDEIGFALDPDVVSVYPYQATLGEDGAADVTARVHNYLPEQVAALIGIRAPKGWHAEPSIHTVEIDADTTGELQVKLRPDVPVLPGRYVFTVDVTLGERRYPESGEGMVVLPAPKATVEREVLAGDQREASRRVTRSDRPRRR